jgi:hypothetical protein
MAMKYNWNPMTADEPDPYPGLLEDEIVRITDDLLEDDVWVATQFEDGRVGTDAIYDLITGKYEPGKTHALLGGRILDQLVALAREQAETLARDYM